MATLAVFVGLDYHQAFVQMCVLDANGALLMNRKCGNSAGALVEAVAALVPGAVVSAAIESCCGAADLAEELVSAGWQVSLAHATYVHKLKQSPDKTDWSDARLLADLLRVGDLPKVWLAPASLRQLRHVVRHRQQLAQARRSAKLRVTALLRAERIEFSGSRWTKLWLAAVRSSTALGEQGHWVVNQLLDDIEHLQSRIVQVESRLAALTQDDAFVANADQDERHRSGDGRDAASQVGNDEPLLLGQTGRAVLRSHAAQRLQWTQASRCRIGLREQRGAARGVDRSLSSTDAVRSALVGSGPLAEVARQARLRDRSGHRQPLGPLAVPPTPAAGGVSRLATRTGPLPGKRRLRTRKKNRLIS